MEKNLRKTPMAVYTDNLYIAQVCIKKYNYIILKYNIVIYVFGN